MYAFVNFIITPLTELFEILVDVQLTMICRKASFTENNSLWFHLGDVAITFLGHKGNAFPNGALSWCFMHDQQAFVPTSVSFCVRCPEFISFRALDGNPSRFYYFCAQKLTT